MRYRTLVLLYLAGTLAAQDPFRDATLEAGIVAEGRARGVSVCDYNDDGYPDVFISNLDGPNLLYRNDGRGTFTEVGHATPLATAGDAMMSLWADFDNDGTQEVFVGNQASPSRFFRQLGGTFVEHTAATGISLDTRVQAGSIFDFDGNGLLDLYVSCLNAPNRLYRNLGNLRFEEVGGAAGAAQTGLAMATLAFDYDLDGDQDLYLIHDGPQPNVLLCNGGGYFTDVSTSSGADVTGDGMGVDAADYDGDGDFDLYITNLYENFLLRNEGDGTFREVAFDARVNDLGMGWGTVFLDYDNDGRPDLYVANETNFTVGGVRYNNILYQNAGKGFRSATEPSAPICSDRSSYGAAVADFNGDGRSDLFVTNSSQPSQLFLNTTVNDHHWIALDLVATLGNRDAIGAKASVYLKDRRLVAEVRAGSSFASQSDRKLHFGLGSIVSVDSILVEWPNGERSYYGGLQVDRLHRIVQGGEVTTSTRMSVERLQPYPNPINSRLYLGRPLQQLRIQDAYGRVVLFHEGPSEQLDLPTTLPAGVYFLTGRTGNRYFTGSFIHRYH